VLEALKAITILPTGTSLPCWIGPGHTSKPEDVIAFQNGLLDLEEHLESGTIQLMPHTSAWFSANCLPHICNPNTTCPQWIQFLEQVFEEDQDRISLLSQWFGYCLTTDIRFHAFLVLLGPPRCGKSTILRVLSEMLGDFNVANPTLSSLGERFGLAPLVGKLAAIIGDGHLGRQSDTVAVLERLKSISGGDAQNIDRKHAAELSNVPITARFSIAFNELPRFPDASAALRSRMILLPISVNFVGREDINLGTRLLAEIPGITNWALQGLKQLRSQGRFARSAAGEAVLEDFARLSSPVRSFVQDCCNVKADLWVPTDELRKAWKSWCVEHGHEGGGEEWFGNQLRAIDPHIQRRRQRIEGRQRYVYRGIDLVESSRVQRESREEDDLDSGLAVIF
jgi:putative DNA primase/helicase